MFFRIMQESLLHAGIHVSAQYLIVIGNSGIFPAVLYTTAGDFFIPDAFLPAPSPEPSIDVPEHWLYIISFTDGKRHPSKILIPCFKNIIRLQTIFPLYSDFCMC